MWVPAVGDLQQESTLWQQRRFVRDVFCTGKDAKVRTILHKPAVLSRAPSIVHLSVHSRLAASKLPRCCLAAVRGVLHVVHSSWLACACVRDVYVHISWPPLRLAVLGDSSRLCAGAAGPVSYAGCGITESRATSQTCQRFSSISMPSTPGIDLWFEHPSLRWRYHRTRTWCSCPSR